MIFPRKLFYDPKNIFHVSDLRDSEFRGAFDPFLALGVCQTIQNISFIISENV